MLSGLQNLLDRVCEPGGEAETSVHEPQALPSSLFRVCAPSSLLHDPTMDFGR
jgi:hypothetical protein